MPTLLLLVGLSSSVHLGEQSPGLVAQAAVYGSRWQAQTSVDTSDKVSSSVTGGWRFQQTLDAVLGPGLLVGAEYGHRRGGWYAKDTLWLRAGYAKSWGQNVLHVIGRATVVSDAGAHNAADQGAIQATYRRYLGRWVMQTEQGALAYDQHGWKWGYYMTATVGYAL